ncbi:MAG TPA: hypothetical protein VFN87_02110 [Solirubrobacteraceae bacterium]|nr:hypothetical protein [Solirubrobacteraceae bacterium]
MIPGLLLALVSAALINTGFLLQHRGLDHAGSGGMLSRLRRALRDPAWLAGQALGWIGFAAQIVAVAIAPLSLVQAFAAGGLALSVPVAAGIFRQPITGTQLLAVLAIAAGLAALPLGFSTARDHLNPDALTLAVAAGAAAGLIVARPAAEWTRAIAAGVFYGIADAAIKAVSLGWGAHGPAALWSGWTAVAAVATFAGFLAFQSALQGRRPVAAISLMTGMAALAALACGMLAFGESLGIDPMAATTHVAAIAIVLAGIPVLAAAQAAMADPADALQQRPPEPVAVPVGHHTR